MFPACSLQMRTLLRGWQSGGGWQPATSSQAAAVGGQGIRSRGGLGALSWSEGEGRPLLTSSVYWTSSTAYFSLKCSLGWILREKHKERQGQGLAAFLPPSLDHEAPSPFLPCWHLAPNGSTQQIQGKWALGHRVTAEPHLPP